MYSPKIQPLLVKRLYHLKVQTGKAMTRLVNEMLEKAIALMETSVYPDSNQQFYKPSKFDSILFKTKIQLKIKQPWYFRIDAFSL